MIIKYGTIENNRFYIFEKIKAEKTKNSNYTVVDIGGVTNGWTADIIDLLVDINTIDTPNSLSVDISSVESLGKLQNYVKEHGMFDYAICTHTLEDIFNPIDILKILPTIAKGGVISMPSANTEFSKCESPHWIGYIHHRWIFDQIDEKMLVIPKLSVLETLCRNRFSFKKAQEEICYEWETSIPFTLFMDNYLGPSAAVVISHYTKLIETIYNRKV